MTGRMPRVTAREVLRALRKVGWQVDHQTGSHLILRHPSRPGRVTVAQHPGAIIKLKTLDSILTQAGLTVDELKELL